MNVTRCTGLLAILIITGLAASAPAQQQDGAIWTTQPTHIDRTKQTYERLPPRVVVRDTRIWIVVPERIRVLDSRSFSVGDTVYEFGHLRPIKAKRLCQAVGGGRWACGRMAAIFLGNLVRGKRLLCDVAQNGRKMVLTDCRVGQRDVAAAIIDRGYGGAEGDEALLSRQAEAKRLAAKGLWRNPACSANFDAC